MLLHFLSITHSFLYTNLISIAKVIIRFMLLCQLSTKWLFVKQFRFSPPFQSSFTNVFFIINNTFKLSLISLLEFVFPHCCFKYNSITKNNATKTKIPPGSFPSENILVVGIKSDTASWICTLLLWVFTQQKHLYKNLSWFWERAENNLNFPN